MHRPELLIPLPWMGGANCATTDPELFFPRSGDSLTAVRRVCANCPVKQACLDYAIKNSVQAGIWGGRTLKERRAIQRRKKAA